jgi:hypothetical protein
MDLMPQRLLTSRNVKAFCWELRAKFLDEGSEFGQQYLASWSGRSEWKVGRW